MSNRISLLSIDDFFGDNRLDVLKAYGNISSISDLAIITGAYMDISCINMASDNNTLMGRTGIFYTSTFNDNNVFLIDEDGSLISFNVREAFGTIRPIITCDCLFDKLVNYSFDSDKVYEVEYGLYPQFLVYPWTSDILNDEYNLGKLKNDGNSYYFNMTKFDDGIKKIDVTGYPVYDFNNKKYVRVNVNSSFNDFEIMLSDCEKYKNGEYVWIEVAPIKWLIDFKNKSLISKIGLLSGVPFDNRLIRRNIRFEDTDMYNYLDNYMIKDIFKYGNMIKDNVINSIKEVSLINSKKIWFFVK